LLVLICPASARKDVERGKKLNSNIFQKLLKCDSSFKVYNRKCLGCFSNTMYDVAVQMTVKYNSLIEIWWRYLYDASRVISLHG